MKNLFNLSISQPLRGRDFRLLWVGQVIAWTGDSINDLQEKIRIIQLENPRQVAVE